MESHNYNTTSARAIIIQDNKLLVEWFAPLSIYFVPGGTVEKGESLLATLQRELKEELQIEEIKIGNFLGKIGHEWKMPDGARNSCLNHFFEAKLPNPYVINTKDVGQTIQWLDLDSNDTQKLQPPSLLLQIFAKQSGNFIEWNIIDSEV